MQTADCDLDLQTSADAVALGQAAFAHVRTGDYAAARPLLDRALALNPRSPMLAHTMAHLTGDSGALEEGAAFMRSFLANDDPAHGLHAHNSWHLASMEMELGRPAAALELYMRAVGPRVAELPMTFFSAVSLLWMLELNGYGTSGGAGNATLPWEELRDVALTLDTKSALEQVGRAMSFIGAGDDNGLESLLNRLREDSTEQDTMQAAITSEVVIPLAMGLRAFHRGDYGAAVALMEPLAQSFARLSTFRDQLVVFEDTLREAQRRKTLG
ncbi:MAG: hypothetical protein AVDCRST_MAG77-4058 [uncultured Chloroflexi bacterium]|uniref:Tetratricopeptide repeat protein 38 n=1 Tax=uncultured Chloroflexota bacterium TaxID=166587 RepID=A0A6J4JPD5_9CHLR|nr:MAG: hypothetical protein AVDCRST_MAG77-4058 [uncultured Chloroflexota bacterium]